MPRSMTLIDLRNAVEKIYNEVLRDRGGEATNEQILSAVKSQHADDIQQLSEKLIDSSLIKLINDVSRRRSPKVLNVEGPDLFGDYPGILRTITLVRGKKKNIMKATILELRLYLETHEKQSQDRNKEMKRLIKDYHNYILSDEDTLETVMQRKRKAENS